MNYSQLYQLTKMIQDDLADDPYAQAHFSKLLKQAIEDARALFDSPVKQYLMFAELENDVAQRKVADIPDRFVDETGKRNRHAQAYYGLFAHVLGDTLNEKPHLDEDNRVALAFDIDKIVKDAVAEFSITPSEIEKAIYNKALPLLFKEVELDNANKMIEEIIRITRTGLSKE